MGHSRTGGPQHERFVTVPNVADMLRLVLVNSRIRICKSETLAKQFDVSGLAGQQAPARPYLMHLLVFLQLRWAVLFRFQSKRIHEEVAPHSVPEQLLYLDHIRRDCRTHALALGIEKVESHDLVLDQ